MGDRKSGEKVRILLVEDEEKLRGTILEYLQLSGYLMLEAGSGAEALRVFGGDESEWPDLVLLDLVRCSGEDP